MKTFNPNNLESHWQFHAKFHGKLYSGPVFQEPLKMRPSLHKFGRIWVRSFCFIRMSRDSHPRLFVLIEKCPRDIAPPKGAFLGTPSGQPHMKGAIGVNNTFSWIKQVQQQKLREEEWCQIAKNKTESTNPNAETEATRKLQDSYSIYSYSTLSYSSYEKTTR